MLKFMKAKLFIVFCITALIGLACKTPGKEDDGTNQEETVGLSFQNAAFKQFLIDSGYDLNNNGGIDEEEAADANEITVPLNSLLYSAADLKYFSHVETVNLLNIKSGEKSTKRLDLSPFKLAKTIQSTGGGGELYCGEHNLWR